MALPKLEAPSAEALAEKFAAYFLTEGNFPSSMGPMYSESATHALPAVSATEIPETAAMYGFAGLSVQAVGYALGEESPPVHIYVTKGSKRMITSLPDEVGGIPVSVHRMGPIKVKPEAAAVTTNLGHIFIHNDRVACGSSCAPSGENYSGTLGALLRKGRSQQLYALSNNHVFAACNHTPVAMPILSPSNMDGRPGERAPGEICVHHSIVELRSGVPALVSPCDIDAAIARVRDPEVVASWQGDDQNGFDTPSTAVDPRAGMQVSKFGRTTGFSSGTIEALINTPAPIPYQSTHFRATVWFHNVWTVRSNTSGPFALPGDSGSLVVTDHGSEAVGLLFAASRDGQYGWIASIRTVLSAFGRDFKLASGHGV